MYIKMKNKNYRVSRATLYNTIELLLNCFIIIGFVLINSDFKSSIELKNKLNCFFINLNYKNIILKLILCIIFFFTKFYSSTKLLT